MASSCTEEEVTTRKYARVSTEEITEITSSGMIFHGKLFFSSGDIMDHGFVWTDTGFPTLTNGNKISLGAKSDLGEFESSVTGTLQQGKLYSVRAYVQSSTYTMYGKILEFRRP